MGANGGGVGRAGAEADDTAGTDRAGLCRAGSVGAAGDGALLPFRGLIERVISPHSE